ncbi:MAG: hypothetical protein H6591_00970 [Flavobacteriales bacterium]|nr:hypothetical protein [Flavobacteriales bacterium]
MLHLCDGEHGTGIGGRASPSLQPDLQEEIAADRQLRGAGREAQAEFIAAIEYGRIRAAVRIGTVPQPSAAPMRAYMLEVAALLQHHAHAVRVVRGLLVVAAEAAPMLLAPAQEGVQVLGPVHALVVQDEHMVLPHLEEQQRAADHDEGADGGPPLAGRRVQQQRQGNGEHRIVIHEHTAAESAAVIPDPPRADHVRVRDPPEQHPRSARAFGTEQVKGAEQREQQHRSPEEEAAPETEEHLERLGAVPMESLAAVTVRVPLPDLRVPEQRLYANDPDAQRKGERDMPRMRLRHGPERPPRAAEDYRHRQEHQAIHRPQQDDEPEGHSGKQGPPGRSTLREPLHRQQENAHRAEGVHVRPARLQGAVLQQLRAQADGQQAPGDGAFPHTHAPEQRAHREQPEKQIAPCPDADGAHLVHAQPVLGRLGVAQGDVVADGEPRRHHQSGAGEVLVERALWGLAHVLPYVGLVAEIVPDEERLEIAVIAFHIAAHHGVGQAALGPGP